MEQFSIQLGVSPTLRPGLSITGDLSAVLQHNRVVAGEVLQRLDGGSVLIGVGNQRVPAESSVELPLGHRFLARVDAQGEELVLRMLGGERGAEAPLVSALRGVVGDDRPVGELLRELAGALRAALQGDADPVLERILSQLASHVFRPESSGAELQNLLARAGFNYEASLLAAATGGKGRSSVADLLQQLAQTLAAELAAAAGGLEGAPSAAEILRQTGGLQGALRAFLAGAGDEVDQKRLQEQIKGLERDLTRSLSVAGEGEAHERVLEALPRILQKLFGGRAGLELLARLRLASGEDLTALLSGNLKAQLLEALAGSGDGEARRALLKALGGIESEQLLNVARKQFQDAWHLSFPIPDGQRWATAHLFYRQPGRDKEPEGEGEGEDRMQRLTVAVDFSALGPLKIDIGLREKDLRLRILATREEVARDLAARVDELGEELRIGGREVRIAVATGAVEEANGDSLAQDIQWLRRHHLMDMSG